MQVYYGVYKILDWPYWFYVFILSFVIFVTIGVIVYSLYQDQKDAIEDLKSQFDCYATKFQAKQSILNYLEKENLKLREEIQTLRQNKSKEKNKEISW